MSQIILQEKLEMLRIQSLRPAVAEVRRGDLGAQTEKEEQRPPGHFQRLGRRELQFLLERPIKILCET